MVAIDNKIEQAMVSGITESLLSPDLAAAYVTQGRTERVDVKPLARSLGKPATNFVSPWRP